MPKLSEVTGAAPSKKLKLSDVGGSDGESPTSDAALKDAREAEKGDSLPGALYQGATLGFGKDIDAGGAYLTTAVRNAMDRMGGKTPKYGAKEAAKATRQAEDETQQRFRKEHPKGSLAAEFGGALMTPGLGVLGDGLKALGLGPLASALGTGAVVGGAGAVGETEGSIPHRLAAAPAGAVTGALTGGAVHGALSLPGFVTRTGGALKEALDRVKIGLDHDKTGEISPKARAKGDKAGLEYVRRLAAKADPTGEKLKAHPAEAAGKPVTAAEALGRQGRTQLKVIGRRSGQTPDALESQLFARNQETGQRVVNDFAEVTGLDPETVTPDMEKLGAKLRAEANPAYQAWHAQTGIDSDELKAIRKTAQFKQAMSHAKELISADREDAFELLGDDSGHVPLMDRNEKGVISPVKSGGKPVMVDKNVALEHAKSRGFEYPKLDEPEKIPTAKGYDYVKRGFDQALEKFRDPKTKRLDLHSPEARAILKVRQELSAELSNEDQPWGRYAKQAFEAGGEPIQLEEAFDSARDLLSNNLREADFRKRIGRMTEAQGKALQAGIVAHARDLAMQGRMRLNDLTTPLAETKLKAFFGDNAGPELVARLKMEAEMKARGARMRPDLNSDTSETLLGAAEQDTGMKAAESGVRAVKKLGRGELLDALGHVLGSPIVGLYRGAQTPIDEAARDMAGALLRGSPSELAKVLEAHGETKSGARRIVDYLTRTGVLDDAKQALSEAGASTAGRRSGISAQIEGRPDTAVDLNPDLSYTPPN